MSEPLHVNGWELRELLRGVAFAAARRTDMSENVRAIHLHATEGRFHAMATDGHRLALMSCALPAMPRLGLPFCSFSIDDAPMLYEACRSPVPIEVRWEPNGLAISGGRLDTPCKLDPAPNEGIPRDYATVPRIFPTEWMGELRGSANRWARQLTHQCTANLDGTNKARVTATESGLELWVNDNLDRPMGRLGGVWRGGEAFTPRALNRFYLLEAIASAPGDAVVLRFAADPTASITITTPDEPAWACALMPVLLAAESTPPLRLLQGGRTA